MFALISPISRLTANGCSYSSAVLTHNPSIETNAVAESNTIKSNINASHMFICFDILRFFISNLRFFLKNRRGWYNSSKNTIFQKVLPLNFTGY